MTCIRRFHAISAIMRGELPATAFRAEFGSFSSAQSASVPSTLATRESADVPRLISRRASRAPSAHHCCHHHHHHGHDADEVFQSWGVETPKKFTEEEIRNALAALDNGETYGIVLRAKGIVPTADGTWLHFDHVPGEIDVRTGTAAVTGRLCVIGSKLDEKALAALFGV